MVLTATTCGSNRCVDMERFGNSRVVWVRRFLILDNGVTSHDTFGQVFARLDVSKCFIAMHS